jgi:hypothetical protein
LLQVVTLPVVKHQTVTNPFYRFLLLFQVIPLQNRYKITVHLSPNPTVLGIESNQPFSNAM